MKSQSAMAEKKLVPELRFPEFDDKWNEVPLGSFLTFKNGVNASKEDYGSGYKFINVLDIIENKFITYDRIQGSVQIDPDIFEKNRVDYGDVLFQRSSETREEVGQANVYLDEKPATFGGFVIRGKKISEYDPRYMNYLLRTQNSRKEIIARSGGSTRYNVGQSILCEIEVILTGLPEQQKIASFLSSVDERLRLLQQKKEKLERYKTGVMQKLFPKAGEKTPEIRFKDDNGKDFPEWEEKKLGEVYNFISTNSYSRNDLNYDKGAVLNIHYGDIHTKFSTHLVNVDQLPFINESVNLEKVSKNQFCQPGDMIFADASEDYDDIGKAIEVVNLEGKKVLAGLHTIHARRISNSIKVGFSGHFVNCGFFRMQIMRIAQGTKVLGISQKRMAELIFFLPVEAEQQKIASFLSSIDRSSEKLETEIAGTEKFKQGLLQKMFV